MPKNNFCACEISFKSRQERGRYDNLYQLYMLCLNFIVMGNRRAKKNFNSDKELGKASSCLENSQCKSKTMFQHCMFIFNFSFEPSFVSFYNFFYFRDFLFTYD